MTTLHEIERAVEKLPADQLAAFRTWFDRLEAERWDERIEADAAAGRLDALAQEALADLEKGGARDL